MENLIDIYEIHKRNSSPFYFALLQISNLKPIQRVIYVFLWFLILVSFSLFVWINSIIDNDILEIFNLVIFGTFIVGIIKLQEKYHRIAFSELYRLHGKEIKFARRKNDRIRYLLLKNIMIENKTYNSKVISTASENLKIELKDPKADSVFKNPLVIIMLTLIANLCLEIYRLINPTISRAGVLLILTVILIFFLWYLILLILDENSRKKKLLQLEQYLEEMILDIKRKTLLALEKSGKVFENSAQETFLN